MAKPMVLPVMVLLPFLMCYTHAMSMNDGTSSTSASVSNSSGNNTADNYSDDYDVYDYHYEYTWSFEEEKNNILSRLEHDYDSQRRPYMTSGVSDNVTVGITIDTFSDISITNMDFTVGIYLLQSWREPRLASADRHSQPIFLTFGEIFSKAWMPDLYFLKEKKAKRHSITYPNVMLQINPDGRMVYSQRLSLTIGCQYNFLRFPMDTQFCKIQMSSYAYTVESLQLLWDEKEPIRFSKSDLNFPEFELVDIETDSGLILDKRGNYSVLTVNVLFSRDLRPYLLNVYIPSIVVVFLAFMSMWIDPRAVPARVTIGVITVLTTMTQSVNTQQGLPKVSYVKAVDVWLATCLVFVVGAMFEYALVNVMIQRLDDRKDRGEIVDVKPALNSISPLSSDAKYLAGTPKQIYWNPAKVDSIGRALFFLCFALFNIIYWTVYLSLSMEDRKPQK